MSNTADVTGGKFIAVLLQSISGVSAINPVVAFFDIHGGKREVLFFRNFNKTYRHYLFGHQVHVPFSNHIAGLSQIGIFI
jgi:hypothetical protein